LFQTIPNRTHVRQILAYPDFAIGFIWTFLLAVPFHGDTGVNPKLS